MSSPATQRVLVDGAIGSEPGAAKRRAAEASRRGGSMPSYRITIRYGAGGGMRYHVDDVAAETLADALRSAAERMPAHVGESADLAEIRVQADPDGRSFTPG
jgi:hypothetical protein